MTQNLDTNPNLKTFFFKKKRKQTSEDAEIEIENNLPPIDEKPKTEPTQNQLELIIQCKDDDSFKKSVEAFILYMNANQLHYCLHHIHKKLWKNHANRVKPSQVAPSPSPPQNLKPPVPLLTPIKHK